MEPVCLAHGSGLSLHGAAHQGLSGRVNTPAFLLVPLALLGLEGTVGVTVGEPLAGVDDEGEGASLGLLLAGCLTSGGLSFLAHEELIPVNLPLKLVLRLAAVSLAVSLQHERGTHQTLVTHGVIGHS